MSNGAAGTGNATDYARTAITQVIALSSGILGISITFAKNFSTNHVPGLLTWSWVLYILAILCGLSCLSSLTGIVMRNRSINEQPLKTVWSLEILALLIGTVFFMAMALRAY